MSRSENDPALKPKLPVSPPPRKKTEGDEPADGPDLRIEEIEDRHVPKDRNIFDK